MLSVNAQTHLSTHAVSPGPSFLSHMHKWAYIRHMLSVITQMRLSMHAVLLEPSLLSHIHTMGVYMASFISQCSNKPSHACSLTRAITSLTHAQNGHTYGIFHQSMLRFAWACVQSRQGLHCSRTCAKWAYIRHIFQSILRRDLVFMQSCQSTHCSHTCAKWAYIRHISTVNALTRLSIRTV